MRRLFSIALIVLVFSGSVGIPLYQHTCLHENITISTLFTGSDHCEEEHIEKQGRTVAPCCAIPSEKQVTKDHCCSEEVTRLALPFNYIEQAQSLVYLAPEFPFPAAHYLLYQIIIPAENRLLYAANSDPPPLSGRELLHINCVWRL